MMEYIEFLILCLAICAFFCGWFAKIGHEQYIADQKREQEAEMRQQEHEQNTYEYYQECIKQQNREKLWHSWVKDVAKGGARK